MNSGRLLGPLALAVSEAEPSAVTKAAVLAVIDADEDTTAVLVLAS